MRGTTPTETSIVFVSYMNLVEEGKKGTKGGAIRMLKEEGQWGEVDEINKKELEKEEEEEK